MRSLSVYLSADMSVLFGDGEGNAVGIYEVDDGIMIIEKFIHCYKEAFDSLFISSFAKYLSEKSSAIQCRREEFFEKFPESSSSSSFSEKQDRRLKKTPSKSDKMA